LPIVFTAGQHRPNDARQFVGNRYHDLIAWSTLGESMHPLPESSRVVLDAKQDRASTVDQHATQINGLRDGFSINEIVLIRLPISTTDSKESGKFFSLSDLPYLPAKRLPMATG
jgi:hypothetical protein